jgi:hypothetical protein
MTTSTPSIGGRGLHRIDDVYKMESIYNKGIEENKT